MRIVGCQHNRSGLGRPGVGTRAFRGSLGVLIGDGCVRGSFGCCRIQVVELDTHLNSPEFAGAVVQAFKQVYAKRTSRP